jgi:hypothetical protein
MKITIASQDRLDQTDFKYLDNNQASSATITYSIDQMNGWLYQFSSPTITENLDLKLMTELLDSNLSIGAPTNINTMEIAEYEKVSSKISAIVAASGILSDLEPEQREAFDRAIKRSRSSENE